MAFEARGEHLEHLAELAEHLVVARGEEQAGDAPRHHVEAVVVGLALELLGGGELASELLLGGFELGGRDAYRFTHGTPLIDGGVRTLVNIAKPPKPRQ
nr:hypothetical protein GCM10025732_05190 [Glycomyces mayteni]